MPRGVRRVIREARDFWTTSGEWGGVVHYDLDMALEIKKTEVFWCRATEAGTDEDIDVSDVELTLLEVIEHCLRKTRIGTFLLDFGEWVFHPAKVEARRAADFDSWMGFN